MKLKLMGKKRGMMQLFDETGNVIVCTVIEAEPNVITQIKNEESDGYHAIQMGFEKVVVKDSRTTKKRIGNPLLGRYNKSGIAPRKYLCESRFENESELADFSLGQEIGVEAFAEIPFVDVIAISKGKGYQGVMKLHNFAGGPASHGSGFHRHAGSTGMRSTPGRCFPGGPRASHMGYDQVTVQNLKVVQVNPEQNVMIVKGQVPGPVGGLVYFAPAKKARSTKKKDKK